MIGYLLLTHLIFCSSNHYLLVRLDHGNSYGLLHTWRSENESSEIKSLLEKGNEGTIDNLVKEVLNSQEDYVVEYRLIQDSDSKPGSSANELPLDDKIITVLSRKGTKYVYGFQQEYINRVLLGMDAIIVAPTASGMIFIHDGSIGGNGASRSLYDRFDATIGRALRILMECPCPCESGCPRFTYSYRCGNNNEYLRKVASIEILNKAASGQQTEIDHDIQADRALV